MIIIMKKLRRFWLKIKVLFQGRRRSQSSCGRSVRKGELVQNWLWQPWRTTQSQWKSTTTSATTDLNKKDCTTYYVTPSGKSGSWRPDAILARNGNQKQKKEQTDHMCLLQLPKTLYLENGILKSKGRSPQELKFALRPPFTRSSPCVQPLRSQALQSQSTLNK